MARSAKNLGVVCLLAVAGCTGPQDFLRTAGPAAHGLARLGWFTLSLFAVVSVVVWLLILWLALRRRGTLAEHDSVEATGGQNWILIGGFAIPAAVLAIVFISTLQTLASYPMACLDQDGPGADRYCVAGVPLIRITGQQWWFDAAYLFDTPALNVTSPTEIHIPVGRPVDIELRTRDVIHSFWLPKLHGKVDLVPGVTNRMRIQADQEGVYEGQCGEYCGVQHAHMRLRLVAQPAEQFQAWLSAQRQPAAEPDSDETRRGRQLFEQSACVLCHTIRGTAARATVGPDLTHLASRQYIAGGSLENNTANLSAWVTHAQSLKPGAHMPDINQFSGAQLRALVAYLQILR